MSSTSTMVTHPFSEKTDRNAKNTNEQRVKIIDVSGAKRFRQNSWAQFYDQIHGLIFVIDASEKSRIDENQETLDELLQHEKLTDKPILM
jgi:GTPase SAR1 family protein